MCFGGKSRRIIITNDLSQPKIRMVKTQQVYVNRDSGAMNAGTQAGINSTFVDPGAGANAGQNASSTIN